MLTVHGLQAALSGLRLTLLVALLGMATAAPGLAASDGAATDAKTPATTTGERGVEATTTAVPATPATPATGPSPVASGEALTADTLPGGAVPWASLPAPPALGGAMVQGGGGGGPTFEYYALDALGSVRVVFDAAGAVKARADYEPFGASIPSSTTGPLPREQFTGQQRDSEVGLDYFGARFYHATHGRMLSVDPRSVGAMADPQRWNRYAYALNSPQTMVDPDGRVAQCKSILINYWYEYDGMHLIHQSYHDECTGGTYPGRGGGGQLPPGEPKPNAEAGTSDELIAEQGVDPEPKSDPPGECLPSGPNGASIDANIERTKAEVMTLGLPVAQWLWINRVRPGGIWDYKVDHGTSAENFGNANYGATANALGFSLNITHRAAGAVQYFAGAWKPYMGTPAGSAPFGDDVSDYFYTGKGWTYGQEGGCK